MISINSSTYRIGDFATDTQKSSASSAETTTIVLNYHTSPSGLTVSISTEAREKLAKEQNEQGQKLAQQLQSNDTEKNKQKKTSESDLVEKMLKEIQAQIKEKKQEIRALKNRNTERAAQKVKMLEAQLISLNASLFHMIGKKLAALSANG